MSQERLVWLIAAVSGLFLSLPLGGCFAEQEGDQLAPVAQITRNGAAPASLETGSGRLVLTSSSAGLGSSRQLLPPGTKSLLLTRRTLSPGEFIWNDNGVPDGSLLIWIDLQRQLASVYRGGHEIGAAVILYGADDHATPLGNFSIINKARDYHSRTYDSAMPFALFLTDDGIAIHASVMGINRATHGCVGLPEQFANLLFGNAHLGDAVSIVRTSG